MCSSVSSAPGTQSISQLLDKLTKPAPAQTPVSSGASTDSMSISNAAQQLAASAAKAQEEAGQ